MRACTRAPPIMRAQSDHDAVSEHASTDTGTLHTPHATPRPRARAMHRAQLERLEPYPHRLKRPPGAGRGPVGGRARIEAGGGGEAASRAPRRMSLSGASLVLVDVAAQQLC